jgi:hypothetical protein
MWQSVYLWWCFEGTVAMTKIDKSSAILSRFGVGMVAVFTCSVVAIDSASAAGQGEFRNCAQKSDPLGQAPSRIKADTSSRRWRIFDQRFGLVPIGSRTVQAPDAAGGRALQIKLDRREALAHTIGVSILNQRPIGRGSIVEARVWLRATSAVPPILVARLQNNEPGFRRLAEAPLSIGPVFQEYVIRTTAYQNYCPGKFNFALHLATGPHTFEIGQGLLIVQENPLVS